MRGTIEERWAAKGRGEEQSDFRHQTSDIRREVPSARVQVSGVRRSVVRGEIAGGSHADPQTMRVNGKVQGARC